LCGIEFKTSLRRSFKCIATDSTLLKTRYDLDVGSGICCDITTQTTNAGPYKFDSSSSVRFQVP